MPESFEYDVFLSHSSKDNAIVSELAEKLRARGLKIWLDLWELRAGEHIPTRIEAGLRASRILVLAMSKHFFISEWTNFETHTFRFRDPTNKELRFIPVRLDNAEIEDSIKPFRYVDYRSNKRTAIKELLTVCSRNRSGSLPQSSERFRSRLPFSHQCVRPLHETEDRYLQVLLPQFCILPHGDSGGRSFELEVSFDDSTPTIWDQSGKRNLLELLAKGKIKEWKQKLDRFLGPGKKDPGLWKPFEFKDDLFIFRYASGGTLPIIRFTGRELSGEYYCFFYRDVYPIGWNIANGGTDSRAELLNPQETIDRELREELIIADFLRDKRYVFAGDKGKAIDHPAHAVARSLWTTMFPHKKLTNLKAASVRVEWLKGPDSLRIQLGDEKSVKRHGFFLNINAEDFGIEFDKVARIHLPGNVILFDGEIDGGYLVNAPIGLFKVNRFNSRVEGSEFRPDHFFFGAALYSGREIDSVLKNRFLPHLEKFRSRDEIEEFRRAIRKRQQYRLCPVTKRIAKRFLQTRKRQWARA